MKEQDRGTTDKLREMIHLSSPATQAVLYQLNGRDDGYYESHTWPPHKLYYLVPVLRRTQRGGHYRMVPALAGLLVAETVEPAGAQPTDPPTVLVTLAETLIRLEDYVEARQDLNPKRIADGIRQKLGLPTEVPAELRNNSWSHRKSKPWRTPRPRS